MHTSARHPLTWRHRATLASRCAWTLYRGDSHADSYEVFTEHQLGHSPSLRRACSDFSQATCARSLHGRKHRSVVFACWSLHGRGPAWESNCLVAHTCVRVSAASRQHATRTAHLFAAESCFLTCSGGCRSACRCAQRIDPACCPIHAQPERDGVPNVCYDIAFKPGAGRTGKGCCSYARLARRPLTAFFFMEMRRWLATSCWHWQPRAGVRCE